MNKLMLLVFVIGSGIYGQDLPQKYKFNFQLDNRLSDIGGYRITIFGGKIGVQYKNKLRFGVGASFITNPVDITGTLKVRVRKKLVTESTEDRINFWYISLFSDWILYKNERWECFITEQIGYGSPVYTSTVNNVVVKQTEIPLLVNEFSGQINYKFLPWLGAGTGFGYRNIWNGNADVKSTFNAPIFIARLIVYPEILFPKHKVKLLDD